MLLERSGEVLADVDDLFVVQGQGRKQVSLRLLAMDPNQGLVDVGVWSRDGSGASISGNIKHRIQQIR